jgi:hypothetical protein
VEIISTPVAVGRGGDYFREISCSESVLWTTDCPLVLACNGLGDSGHFLWSLYTFRIQSVFLLSIKYTHDYPHAEGKELTVEISFDSSEISFCVCQATAFLSFPVFFIKDGVFFVMFSVDDTGGSKLVSLCSMFFLFSCCCSGKGEKCKDLISYVIF